MDFISLKSCELEIMCRDKKLENYLDCLLEKNQLNDSIFKTKIIIKRNEKKCIYVTFLEYLIWKLSPKTLNEIIPIIFQPKYKSFALINKSFGDENVLHILFEFYIYEEIMFLNYLLKNVKINKKLFLQKNRYGRTPLDNIIRNYQQHKNNKVYKELVNNLLQKCVRIKNCHMVLRLHLIHLLFNNNKISVIKNLLFYLKNSNMCEKKSYLNFIV